MKFFKVALFVATISFGVQASPLAAQATCTCAGENHTAPHYLASNSDGMASPREQLHILRHQRCDHKSKEWTRSRVSYSTGILVVDKFSTRFSGYPHTFNNREVSFQDPDIRRIPRKHNNRDSNFRLVPAISLSIL